MLLSPFSSRVLFLSTLSARRATNRPAELSDKDFYFYPRSPRGERLYALDELQREDISIHALREESDPGLPCRQAGW